MIFARFLRQRSITSVYMWGALALMLLVGLFTAIAVYEEYREFDIESQKLRKQYIDEQKAQIRFDTNRVLRFIENEYNRHHGEIDDTLLQSQAKNAIEQLYGRQDGTGYIFIYDTNGTCLSDPVQRGNVGKNLYNFKDSNGVQVIRKLIEVSYRPDGGYVAYNWLKPTTGQRSPKISYARLFAPWHWMVGTGVYLDEVEKVIQQRKEALREKSINSITKIVLLMLMLFIVGLLGVRLLNNIVRREIRSFNRHFEQATRHHIQIDERQVRLEEFKTMAHYVNEMLSGIHRRKARLKELNASLEEKVLEQTDDLRESNRQLREEKAFSETLLKAQDSFIRQAIHEINTPLAVIMTHIDIFKMKHGENRYLAKIEAATKMIANIYDDLSYVVKRKRVHYEKSQIDLSSFLLERIRFFQEIALGNGLLIAREIEPGLTACFSDIELQRIVDNNLSNAIKYAKADSEIRIVLRREEGGALLEFHTRSRQPISDPQRIFDAFHREDKEVEGFGLGLQIVREICEKNGVEIELDAGSAWTVFRYRFGEELADACAAA
ncbi:sensor histidine kinase [Nitratifractor sp.]